MSRPLTEPAVLDRARAALAELPLCDGCLGRLFGKVETGLTNEERGAIVRAALGGAAATAIADCGLCRGLLAEIPALGEIALDALAPYELSTYLVGTKVDEDVTEREKALHEKIGADKAEMINTHLNREIGKVVAAGRPGVAVDFKDPHLTVVVDTRFDHATLQHGGLFLKGRYLKHERGIPQTIWPCGRCRGRGCVDCDGRGKMYPTSVQEIVAAVPLEWTGATEAAFHGAGREDVDARCLGTGRPFVLELKDPRRRALDLPALERAVNDAAKGAVEVRGLALAEKREVAATKEFRGTKTYRAWVRFEAPVPSERFIKGIGLLRGAPVAQRTPTRVEHRRADLVRERRVLGIDAEAFTGTEAVLRITGDAGLYIKELVSGDEGRTTPSLAELVGAAARVTDLDILAVESYEDA